MRRLATALLALTTLAAAPAPLPVPPVSRWDSLPRLAYRPDFKPRPIWIERAKALSGEGEGKCTFKPDDQGVVRLSVPFVVTLDAKGAVAQAAADMPDCPALAAIVETFARQLGPKQLTPSIAAPGLWRASHFLAGWEA